MKKVKEWEKAKAGGYYLCIFLLMLFLNILTLYISDDFRYLYSFYDYERIESLPQIIMSMRAHRYSMNGRIVVHTLVQIFGMFPMWVFDIVNSGIFVLQVALMHKLAKGEMSRNPIVILMIFCGIWLFCPVFGQVNLWQDGSFNYLWGSVLSLFFLQFYAEKYWNNKNIQTLQGKICFILLSFGVGAYSETASATSIFMAVILLALSVFERRRKCEAFWLASVLVAFLGYITIYLAPAQLRQKSAEMTMSALLSNFMNISMKYWSIMGVLLCAFIVTLVLNIRMKTERRRICLAMVFLVGSLAAHFILVFAQYYVPRSSSAAMVYILAADAILLYPLLDVQRKKLCTILCTAILSLATVPSLGFGICDIVDTYYQMKENEAYIYECRAAGIMDVEVPIIISETNYSVANSGRYLKEDPTTWPNEAMAVYYGVDSLTGIYEE